MTRSVPVLMYHHVSPVQGMITVSPANFEDQLRWLRKHGYRSLTCEQFAAHLEGEPAPPRSVLITFDDGYLDNWVYAYPLMKQYGFNGVIFLVTSWIGEGTLRPHLGEDALPETPSHHDCEDLIEHGEADKVMLRWSEVEAMRADRVFEFHSHTHTHTRWDLGPDKARKNEHMVAELEASRAILAERLGGVSQHFCWPQGYFDADYIRIAREAGFRYLYTTQAFGRNLPGHDPAHIHRFAVRNTSGQSVGRRIVVGSHPLIAPVFHRFKLWKRARRERS
ncbi:MAG TPA: polysaccharide deacetylase family protein [Burkholderiaceae bacterium]|nr:polysaccharide deacetylase family protein [Burkholderiaceae bacterium]